jgi:hypothetical protein
MAHLIGIADKFETRMQNLNYDMQAKQCFRYKDSDGIQYVQFKDGSVIVEPDMDNVVVFDKNEWRDFENAQHLTVVGWLDALVLENMHSRADITKHPIATTTELELAPDSTKSAKA